ncbi:formyltransferase [Perilla frutescens var. hirtella]|nr:formyltransferase [Perilla frutescens var. hirtella]
MSSSTLMLRRFYCISAAASSPASSAASSSHNLTSHKKRLVYLGSPQVSASVLDALFTASSPPDSLFEIAAIVTQPPSGRDRGRKVMPSPVAQHALDRGFPSDLIFTPIKAGEESFLCSFKALEPELCITAAYGNILPTKFLKIPSMGTVNIHPSLLPLYRGAAPVQRTLEDGVRETGVSLAYTVRQLDAGPVIACEKVEIDDQIKAPELLEFLFSQGSKLLISELPSILDGSAKTKAIPQDESRATLAPKLTPEESWLSFDQKATVLHNKVRAFAGWPGTRAKVVVIDPKSDEHNTIDLKIITTRVGDSNEIQNDRRDGVVFAKGSLIFPCGEGTTLEVLEVQLPGKKVVNAAAFWNGLRGQKTVDIRVKLDCDGCERRVKNAVKTMKGVRSVEVNRKQERVTVSGFVDAKKVLKRVKNTGKKTAELWPFIPYNLSQYPYASQAYDRRAPAGFVRNVDVALALAAPPPPHQGINYLFSDENPNACSIM